MSKVPPESQTSPPSFFSFLESLGEENGGGGGDLDLPARIVPVVWAGERKLAPLGADDSRVIHGVGDLAAADDGSGIVDRPAVEAPVGPSKVIRPEDSNALSFSTVTLLPLPTRNSPPLTFPPSRLSIMIKPLSA